MKNLVLLGRILFSLIFAISGFGHFKSQTVQYAVSHHVPLAEFLVPVAGIMAILGGLSIMTGFKAKFGACLIILFLIPVTLFMHNFWAVEDPMQHQIQHTMFLKNTSMLGGAFLIAYFGAGPMSFDNKNKKEIPVT